MALAGAMIFVKDLARMEAFYAQVLELTPTEATRHPDWVEFASEGAVFSLHAIPEIYAADIEIATPPEFRDEGCVKLSFRTPDLAAARARLEALDGQIVERPWGGWEAVDPEGNIFALLESPRA
jgi:predicted enzyme related to lactoylglutathione lyase